MIRGRQVSQMRLGIHQEDLGTVSTKTCNAPVLSGWYPEKSLHIGASDLPSQHGPARTEIRVRVCVFFATKSCL